MENTIETQLTNKLKVFRREKVQIMRYYGEALRYDKENGNSLWREAVEKELKQILDYGTFRDEGTNFVPKQGYKQIPLQWIFDIKFDYR